MNGYNKAILEVNGDGGFYKEYEYDLTGVSGTYQIDIAEGELPEGQTLTFELTYKSDDPANYPDVTLTS